MASKASGHIIPHRREAACFMEPHGYRLICLRCSVLPSAPHSLRPAPRGPEVPMDQGGGLHVSRGD